MRFGCCLIVLWTLTGSPAGALAQKCAWKCQSRSYRPIPCEYARYFNPYLGCCPMPKVGFAPGHDAWPRQHYRPYADSHLGQDLRRIYWGYYRHR